MKNALLKFAGLFIERVPVDEAGRPLPQGPGAAPGGGGTPGAGHGPGQSAGRPGPGGPQYPVMPAGANRPATGPPGTGARPAAPGQGPGTMGYGQPMPTRHPDPALAPAPPSYGMPARPARTVSVALRAWVPEEYAAHLAPYGVHVIAAGGAITSEQARGWGADVLVVSAECLGNDLHLLQQPKLPTVFITPQPAMIPEVAGVVQAQEPLRASDVARATLDALATWPTASF